MKALPPFFFVCVYVYVYLLNSIFIPTLLFFSRCPFIWSNIHPVIPLLFAYMFLLAVASMLKTSWTDPGVSNCVCVCVCMENGRRNGTSLFFFNLKRYFLVAWNHRLTTNRLFLHPNLCLWTDASRSRTICGISSIAQHVISTGLQEPAIVGNVITALVSLPPSEKKNNVDVD